MDDDSVIGIGTTTGGVSWIPDGIRGTTSRVNKPLPSQNDGSDQIQTRHFFPTENALSRMQYPFATEKELPLPIVAHHVPGTVHACTVSLRRGVAGRRSVERVRWGLMFIQAIGEWRDGDEMASSVSYNVWTRATGRIF